MHMRLLSSDVRLTRPVTTAAAIVLALGAAGSTQAATIWDGPSITFTKNAFADPTQAVNQDRITPRVWLTRGNIQGLYNAKLESAYQFNSSPADTTWANGTLDQIENLSFTDWQTWSQTVNGGPPNTVGIPAVVHLVTEDIYLSVTFLSWNARSNGGGGFSYTRSTIPAPASAGMLVGAGLIAARRRRR